MRWQGCDIDFPDFSTTAGAKWVDSGPGRATSGMCSVQGTGGIEDRGRYGLAHCDSGATVWRRRRSQGRCGKTAKEGASGLWTGAWGGPRGAARRLTNGLEQYRTRYWDAKSTWCATTASVYLDHPPAGGRSCEEGQGARGHKRRPAGSPVPFPVIFYCHHGRRHGRWPPGRGRRHLSIFDRAAA